MRYHADCCFPIHSCCTLSGLPLCLSNHWRLRFRYGYAHSIYENTCDIKCYFIILCMYIYRAICSFMLPMFCFDGCTSLFLNWIKIFCFFVCSFHLFLYNFIYILLTTIIQVLYSDHDCAVIIIHNYFNSSFCSHTQQFRLHMATAYRMECLLYDKSVIQCC